MARQRRGGCKPPELRGTLGTLLRTTLLQAGVVRDALERGAREGRSRLDDFRADRRRGEALAELGELVLDLIRKGEIDLGELPEARALVDQLDELDRGEGSADEVAMPRSRSRFDGRGGDDGTVPSATWSSSQPARRPANVWRPVEPEDDDPVATPPPRAGGIQFADDDEEDLAGYMNPDDVPPKPVK